MKIVSPAFEHNKTIPKKYTCQGDNINPPLQFSDVPDIAKSLALIVDDPDATVGTFDHWVVFNIPKETTHIQENSVPHGALQGKNGAGEKNFIGPCPPSGTHRYFFKLYALDSTLSLNPSAGKADVEAGMKVHILDKAELIGLYKKE